MLKLIGIAGIIALLGALQIKFGTDVTAIALVHLAVIAAAVLAKTQWRGRGHRTQS